MFAVLVAAAGPLLTIVLGDSFKDSIPMVRLLAPLVPLRALASFPLNGLMGLGRTFARTMLLVGSAALSMILYIALIPDLRWKGAAYGTLIGEASLAVAAWAMLLYYQRKSDLIVDNVDLEAELVEADAPGHWVQ